MSLSIGVNTKNFLKFSETMQYYLKDIGDSWNEVLDEYLEQKETNKELTWHDYYIKKSDVKQRKQKIAKILDDLIDQANTGTTEIK